MHDAEGNYSFGERIMHRIALGYTVVPELSFDMERALYLDKARSRLLGPPIFVCGLARAGTTIIMRSLHSSKLVASLTYRDMPFPLAPNLWAHASGGQRRQTTKRARGHADGLDHDLDSPEAMEEAFWRCMCGSQYIRGGQLLAHRPSAETLEAFGDLMSLICLRYGTSRYLSKNNNNVLRLPALKHAFPDGIFLHPFRDPIQQGASLLSQHVRTKGNQARDPFRAEYAAMLAHHEFGDAHRKWDFCKSHSSALGSQEYWVSHWTDTYAHLLEVARKPGGRHLFLDFDALCARPGTILDLLSALGLPNTPELPMLQAPPVRAVDKSMQILSGASEQVYAELREIAFHP